MAHNESPIGQGVGAVAEPITSDGQDNLDDNLNDNLNYDIAVTERSMPWDYSGKSASGIKD